MLFKFKTTYETIANKMQHVQCPNCQTRVEWSNDQPYRPFCSKRCRMIDFGAWANETYTIASNSNESKQDPESPPAE